MNDVVIYEVFFGGGGFNITQGRMNGAANKTRTHLRRFASQANC